MHLIIVLRGLDLNVRVVSIISNLNFLFLSGRGIIGRLRSALTHSDQINYVIKRISKIIYIVFNSINLTQSIVIDCLWFFSFRTIIGEGSGFLKVF